MILLEGKPIKEEILLNLKEKVSLLDKKPKLVIIQVGDEPASNIYIKNKINMCNKVGYDYEHLKFVNDIDTNSLLMEIDKLNKDNNVSGIIVQMPLPKHIDTYQIQNKVDYKKDVDGLNDINISKLINNQKALIPCTPKGIISLLDYYKIDVLKKHVVVVGRSTLVGKPIFNLLINKNATVTLCHSKTDNLSFYTKQADILIVAVGHKHLITKDMVKENSVIIDVGINRVDNKLYGDVDFDNVKDKVSYITPVPGGVGQLTVASLAENILESYNIIN